VDEREKNSVRASGGDISGGFDPLVLFFFWGVSLRTARTATGFSGFSVSKKLQPGTWLVSEDFALAPLSSLTGLRFAKLSLGFEK
jgi:hypothetical protein